MAQYTSAISKKPRPTIETESLDVNLPPLTGRTNFLSPIAANANNHLSNRLLTPRQSNFR